MVAKNANLEKLSDKSFQLVLDKKFEMLATQQTLSILTKALSNFYGTDMELKTIFDIPKSLTPEQYFQALDAERSRFAEHSIKNDEVVKILQAEFGAKIIEGSSRLLH